MDDFLSITQVAEKLGVTRQYAHRLYKAGKFPNAIDKGAFILIPAADVEALKQRKGA